MYIDRTKLIIFSTVKSRRFQFINLLIHFCNFWDSHILQKCVMDSGNEMHRDGVKFVKILSKVFGDF